MLFVRVGSDLRHVLVTGCKLSRSASGEVTLQHGAPWVLSPHWVQLQSGLVLRAENECRYSQRLRHQRLSFRHNLISIYLQVVLDCRAGGLTATPRCQGTPVRSGAVATRRLIPSVAAYDCGPGSKLPWPSQTDSCVWRQRLTTTLAVDRPNNHGNRARRSIGMPLETTWTS